MEIPIYLPTVGLALEQETHNSNTYPVEVNELIFCVLVEVTTENCI